MWEVFRDGNRLFIQQRPDGCAELPSSGIDFDLEAHTSETLREAIPLPFTYATGALVGPAATPAVDLQFQDRSCPASIPIASPYTVRGPLTA